MKRAIVVAGALLLALHGTALSGVFNGEAGVGLRGGLALVGGPQGGGKSIGPAIAAGLLGDFGLNVPIPGQLYYAPSVDMWLKATEEAGFPHSYMEISLNVLEFRYEFEKKSDSKVKPFMGLGVPVFMTIESWDYYDPPDTSHDSSLRVKGGLNVFGGFGIQASERVRPFLEVRGKISKPNSIRVMLGVTFALKTKSGDASEGEAPKPATKPESGSEPAFE